VRDQASAVSSASWRAQNGGRRQCLGKGERRLDIPAARRGDRDLLEPVGGGLRKDGIGQHRGERQAHQSLEEGTAHLVGNDDRRQVVVASTSVQITHGGLL
jgi:hypothetical protein